MDAPPNTDLVYQGICALFNNTNVKDKEKASKWLEQFQKSIHSWTIADELLQQKRDLHSCYFAAQTMRSKIQHSFDELPLNSHESLRDSLINHISQITDETETVIVTQLCLAVADLALLMSSWENPVNDLLEMYTHHPQLMWPLLEILKLIPEEIESRYLRLGANRRDEILRHLDIAFPKLMDFLCLCQQRTDKNQERILNSALRCYNSWITIRVIPLRYFTENSISQQVFELLHMHDTSRKLHETCTECLCGMLNSIKTSSNQDDIDRVIELQIFNAVYCLESAYHMSVANEDIDKTMNYCRIFTVLCDSFMYDMLDETKAPHFSLKGLELVLICVGHFDYEVAEITFNLWYMISEELFQNNNDNLSVHFRPHVERLLEALYRHAQIESDQRGLIDENDNFADFRRKVSDLIKDVAFIVGSGTCFKQMFLILQNPNNSWEATESALFVMQNVAKNILPDENEIVPKVVEAILNLPDNTHIAVRYTSIILLGELCDWIESHPDILQAVLNFLLYSLQQKNGLAPAAAIALTSICCSCRHKMIYHINGLIEIARSLDSFEINNELSIGFLKGISQILSRLPRERLEPAMREIVSFQLQPLSQLVENSESSFLTIKKGENSDPVYWIDRASAIIRHTLPELTDDELHPTTPILLDAWPLIKSVIGKYQADVRIMERTCRLLRYGIRTVRQQASVLVESLVKQIVCTYSVYHHSCFLYLGSVLVDEYAKQKDCILGLLEMLKAFIEPTFSMLQVENGLKNNPDTVDDFFRLCSRLIDQCPLPFLQSELVTPIFQCAMLASTLDHREANSSVMKFFSNLFRWGRTSNARFVECCSLVKEIALQHGEALIINLIHASVFSLHSYMLTDVCEVIIDFMQVVSRECVSVYIKTALDSLPKKNSGGGITATQQQLDDFCVAVFSAENPKSLLVSLKGFIRLYR